MARKKKVEVEPVAEVSAQGVEAAVSDTVAAPVVAAPAVESPVVADTKAKAIMVVDDITLIEKIERAISSVLTHQMGNNAMMHNLRAKLMDAVKGIR